MSAIVELLDPVRHLRTYLEQGVRFDQRHFLELRNLSIECHGRDSSSLKMGKEHCYGSAEVRLGATIVSCDVTLKIGTPSPLAPHEGDLEFDVSLSGLCDPKYENFRTKHDDALDLESLLTSVFIDGRIVDLKCLCITAGEYAFRVCVGLTVLSHDGNIQDAVILAVMSALHSTKMPDVVFPSELPLEKQQRLRQGKFGRTKNHPCIKAVGNPDKPLVLLAQTLPMTVAIFLNSEKEWDMSKISLLIDPTKAEEVAVHSTVTAVLRISSSKDLSSSDGNNQLCGIFCSENDDIGSSDPRCRGGTPNDYIPSLEDSPSTENGGVISAAIKICIEHAKLLLATKVPFLH